MRQVGRWALDSAAIRRTSCPLQNGFWERLAVDGGRFLTGHLLWGASVSQVERFGWPFHIQEHKGTGTQEAQEAQKKKRNYCRSYQRRFLHFKCALKKPPMMQPPIDFPFLLLVFRPPAANAYTPRHVTHTPRCPEDGCSWLVGYRCRCGRCFRSGATCAAEYRLHDGG